MEKDKTKKAWGVHYPTVEKNLDVEGWYNGGNDKVQKTFEGLEITKCIYHQIPTSLLKPVTNIIEPETAVLKEEKKK